MSPNGNDGQQTSDEQTKEEAPAPATPAPAEPAVQNDQDDAAGDEDDGA